jgi:hypothetical protein
MKYSELFPGFVFLPIIIISSPSSGELLIPLARFVLKCKHIYEEWCLLGCYAVWLLFEPTFRRNFAPPFLRSVRRLRVRASAVPSSPSLVTLMK